MSAASPTSSSSCRRAAPRPPPRLPRPACGRSPAGRGRGDVASRLYHLFEMVEDIHGRQGGKVRLSSFLRWRSGGPGFEPGREQSQARFPPPARAGGIGRRHEAECERQEDAGKQSCLGPPAAIPAIGVLMSRRDSAGKSLSRNLGPRGQTGRAQRGVGLGDGVGAEVEDARRRGPRWHGPGHAFHQVLQVAHPAAGDHRHGDGIGNGAGQLEVIARCVPSPSIEVTSSSPAPSFGQPDGVFHRVDPGRACGRRG
jgi:hypothetical protein